MKTLGFAMALALTGAAAQAGTLFEVPINGGIARFQLDDNCDQSVCASISWTESNRHHEHHKGKETSQKELAKPSARAELEPAAKTAPSDSTPALASDPANSEPNAEPPVATLPPPAVKAVPAERVPEQATVARIAPPQPAASAKKATAMSPVGEWLVENGEARIRVEECAKNLCGVITSTKNASETDRKNPDPELRKRPVIGLPVLLDMEPTAGNRWEGRIYNAKNGQTYTANISLLDPQKLRVEGCVFGGFICGGQNWTRVN